MDDETYLKLNFKTIPGHKFYMGVCRKKVKAKFKTIKLKKFPQKIMVRQAICQCGLKTQSFVTNFTINSEIYQKNSLEKHLLPVMQSFGLT